jgi:flagellar L-ring protein precursor FlgH
VKAQLKIFATVLAASALAACSLTREPEPDDPAYEYPETPPAAANGAIYQSGNDVPLFENTTAHRVGDTITIHLVESTAAEKSSSTSTSKTTDATLAAPTVFGRGVTVHGTPILSGSLSGDRSFDGKGDSKQSNKLDGDITVMVQKRLPNGNLLVRGQKWITINQGREFVKVQGIVRPIDVQPDNSIESTRVANAVISYGGKGQLADANKPGLLARFFNSPWMPF